ncbi:tetratricopeptide repeat protein [Bradyrhizobium mercantei]|uniref:tetratricopeptide repeat protein n=1 Tax=Bradyrhizobium mercantei TaxID=1904807 RepID=UPI00097688F5|nr:tetratricopeptide repeat protein [Bradyrhizobium mercantei]
MSAAKKAYQNAINAMNGGRPLEAVAHFDKALALKPDLAEAWLGRGNAFAGMGRHDEAVAAFDRAIALKPDLVGPWLGHLLTNLGRFDRALAAYDKVIALRPNLAEAWLGRCHSLVKLQRYAEALAAYDKALALEPGAAAPWLGHLLASQQRYGEALAAYDKTLAIKPDLIEAWLARGDVLFRLARLDDALAGFDKVLALKPDLPEAWLGRGNLLTELKRYDEAGAAYDKALALKSNLAEAWLGRGNLLVKLDRQDEALAPYDKALSLKPDLMQAWLSLGNVFVELERYDEALAACERALKLKPDLAEAWLGRGLCLLKLDRYGEALATYDKALALKPDLAGAWLGRGNVLHKLKRFDEALAAHDKALAFDPELTEAWCGRGNVFTDRGRYDEALAAYDKALALKPDLAGLEGVHLQLKMNLCRWESFASDCNQVIGAARDDKPFTDPFTFVAVSPSGKDQYDYARRWVGKWHPPAKTLLWNGEIYQHDKIRIAYVSSDFQEHPVAHLTAGMFENHDTSRFETTAVSIGPANDSAMRRRLQGAFGEFLEASLLSDAEVAAKLRAAEIDILVDLNGYTRGSRTNIFAQRPAPIQVGYLGYPGTSGADVIDYIIADRTIIPDAQQGDFSEKIAYLPNSYQANDSTRAISETVFTREECGLPEHGFVFCCFNNLYKITPVVFDLWMRILSKVPGSVLWLREDNATAAINLKKDAEARGVSAERIVFAKRVASLSDHLARHRAADLFLDTLPFNAHTTASDALWAGLPVLTQAGEALAGRVAASLLNAVGLPELITHNSKAYEDLAIEIARQPETLKAIKTKLAQNRLTAPLFDTKRFTRQIEAAYIAMYQRGQAGLAPETFVVPD